MALLLLRGKNKLWRKNMKKKLLTNILLITLLLFLTNSLFAQNSKTINLLAVAIQENGLPKGWSAHLEGSGRAEMKSDRSLYFERDFPDDKCALSFSIETPDGTYNLLTSMTIDGNDPMIMLDSQPLQETNTVKAINGKLTFYITVKGAGKVWGRFHKIEITPAQTSENFSNESIEKIKSIAVNSPITQYFWKDRGKAPIGYIKGVALTYAKSYRELKTQQNTAVTVMSQPVGDKKTDALGWYGIAANSDVERLRKIYTLALGLGMRESSGNTTVGWDKSKLKAKPPIQPTAENSEAGLFQTSWDSRNKSLWLLKLYNQYQPTPNQCSLPVFMEKVKDKNEPIYGEGEGEKFQKFNKECPAFATEYVMIMLRVNRSHFGPINGKKAEYNLDAEKMFKDIEKVVDKTL